ncbi:complement factor H-like isoform X5 [Ascaphus truei]|uniref:complement factor H-like isoform X5 n=1 Tax=Ascaphus truei TaxID=8439 RepID=UPI003F5A9AC0
MSLVGYLILLTAALCWTVHGAPAPGSCIKPERKQEAELQGVWEDDTYPENTQAIFNCRPGYSRLGSMKYICLRGKWETVGTLGKCRKKSCGDPGDVAFGSFELKLETEFVFGARVVYHCDEGYQMVSRQNTRDCTASGWSNFPPHCEVRRCPPLDVDVGVTVISSSYDDEEFSVGKVIRFECKNPKFGLEGPAEVFCKSEGQWNSPPPICQVISCSTPQISNGNVRIKKETYMENEIMTYACNAKYKPDTRTGVTCTRSGWSPSPSCVEIACYAESVANGEVVKDKDVYREGDIIELKCNRGFKIEYEPDAPRKCTAMGWSPSLKCISLACDRPVIENGRLYYHYYDYQFPQRINRELDYFCKDGFLPPEKSYYGRITCTEDGWSPEPKCLKTCSNNDIRVENADLRRTLNMYVSGEKVQYSCNPGLTTPDGKEGGEIECLPNGKFSPGKCLRECKMSNLDHGSYQTDKNIFEVGEYLRYTCDKGFRSPRNRTTDSAQCLQQGWSVPPQCVEITCSIESTEKKVYKDGDTVRINCQAGYTLRGSKVSQCYYYGWDPPLPTCEETPCTIPRNSNIKPRPNKSSYQVNEEVTFSCHGILKLTGSDRSRCSDDGWRPQLPTCEETPCTIPRNSNIKSRPNKSSYQVNEEVTFSCHGILKLTGSDKSRCSDDGWRPQLPTCEETPCTIPRNSNIKSRPNKSSYQVNEEVTFSCHGILKLTGSDKSRCSDDGWRPQLPTCEETPCTIPRNSNIKSRPNKSSYQVNEEVTFSCHGILKLTGSDKSRCSDDGWRPQLPTCEETRCTIPRNSNFKPHPNKSSYQVNEEVRFFCDGNFKLTGLDRSRCSADGWHPQLPTCEEEKPDQPDPTTDERDKDSPGKPEQPPTDKSDTSTGEQSPDKPERRPQCPPPPRPINTQESIPKNGYYNGDTVEIKCKAGYKLHGSGTVLCDNGKWESSPQCVELKKCGNPPSIDNGEMIKESTQEEYYSDSVVRYRCKTGLHITGSNESYCYNGRWSSPPICTGDPCGKAPPVEFGHIPRERQNYVDGESVQYTCLEGYKLVGETSAKCLEGKWWQLPSCIYTACEPPPKIPHGRLKANLKISYRSGDKVSYECDSGYALEKKMTNEAVCADTQWKQIPVCRRLGEVCNPPPTVENGDITDSRQPSYRSGSVVEYKCPSYYKLKGNQKVKCENGVWDDPPICLEPCTAGERVMRANNIQLRWTDIKKLYSEHDDEMEFGCLNGYEPSPSAVFRVKCNRGELLYPKCIKRGSCLLSQETMERNSIFINRSTEIEQGETIEFKCNEGMVPENTLTATCQKKTIIYPKCTTRKKCKSAPVVANGKLKTEAQRSYDSGASVEFECREDTVLAGSINVKCDNGQWSEPPQCLESCKISKEELGRKNVELQLSEDMSKTHKHGSEVNFKCKSGSNRPYRPASLKGECSNGKMIYPRCFTGQTCRLYQEKVDENFLELDPIHDNEGYYGDGEIVQFICKQGFYSHSALKGNCTKGELTYPECKRKNACYINQEILDKHNLELSTSQQHRKYFASSTEITFTCKPGYAKNNKTITKKCIKGVIMYPEIHCRLGTSV